MTILVESPDFNLAHDSNCSCLYATWYGQHNSCSTQANYELIFGFVRSTHSTKLLNDGLLDQNGWQELTLWLADNYFRRLAAEGLKTIAWVLPRDVEALRDTQQLLALLEEPLVGTFDDQEAAYRWLQKWPMPSNSKAPRLYL